MSSCDLERISSGSDLASARSERPQLLPSDTTYGMKQDEKLGRRGSLAASLRSEDGGMSRHLSRTLTAIKKAVEDELELEDDQPESLNKILETHFDVNDALRLTETNQRLQENAKRTHDTGTSAEELSEADAVISYKSDVEREVDEFEEEHTLKKVFTNKDTNALDLPPDGGYGWICCLCVTLIMFSTWGCNSAFGIFLAFYLNNSSFAGASKYDYALIAGMTVALGQGLPPFVLLIMRVIGLKPTMYIGIVILCLGFVLASYAVSLWQLYLTQGLLSGIGISFIFAPATTVLPGWFLKKRSFALGVSLTGTGAGGVVYSLAVNKMIQNTGDQKLALRVLAITCTVVCVGATVMLRERMASKPSGIKDWRRIIIFFKEMFSVRIINSWTVQLIAVWFMFALFGYTLMIFTLSSYAVANGLTSQQGSSLTAILNGAQCIGRPLMGYSGDKLGRTNITVVLTTLLTIFMFGFWIPANTYASLIGFSICIGLTVGVANVMNTVLVADIIGPKDFLLAWGYVNLFGSPFLLVSEVIAQSLTVPSSSEPYLHTQIFSGCCFFAALVLVLGLRELTVKMKLMERQKGNKQRLQEYEDFHSTGNEEALLKERELRYAFLLGPGFTRYVARMFYPMKV